MNFTYMLGFGLVSEVVGVFRVSSLPFARKSTWKIGPKSLGCTTRPDDELGSEGTHVTARSPFTPSLFERFFGQEESLPVVFSLFQTHQI